MDQIKILFLNTENLFLGPQLGRVPWPRSPTKAQDLARAILDINPDIALLCEIGGVDSLEIFNKDFLSEKFVPSLIEGNSDRGIHLGALFKKNLPFRFEHLTHRDRPLLSPHPAKFSRDLLEIRVLSKETSKNDEEAIPLITLLGVHLKSKLDSEGKDFEGRKQRAAEVKTLIATTKALNKRWKGQVPILLMGDFNGIASPHIFDPEFAPLYEKNEWQELLELKGYKQEERVTFIYFNRQGAKFEQQLDYIFIPTLFAHRVDLENSAVYYYKNNEGLTMALPHNPLLKALPPSDHYPIYITFHLK